MPAARILHDEVLPLPSNSCTIPWEIRLAEGGCRVWHGLCLWGTGNQTRGKLARDGRGNSSGSFPRLNPSLCHPRSIFQPRLLRNREVRIATDSQTMRVLIVDDERNVRHILHIVLKALGHNLGEAYSSTENGRLVNDQPCDLVFVGLRLGNESEFNLLETLRQAQPRLAGGAMTENSNIASAMGALGPGSLGDAPGTLAADHVPAVIERLLRHGGPGNQVTDLEGRMGAGVPESEMESADPQVRRTIAQARIAAPCDASLLIRGEQGTGKRTLARAIHAWSKRSDGPFVTVSCPRLSLELLGSELFGHVRGAFPAALGESAGKIAAAEGGTLFLGEVGALPAELQPRLLRLIHDQQYERVGEAVTRSADVRVVAATGDDLEAAVARGAFRQELLHRLSVIELTLPPLRHRCDLCALADHFLAGFARQTGSRFTGFSPEAREALVQHTWPGNLCELRNAIERVAILGTGPEVKLADLPERIGQALARADEPIEVGRRVSLEALEDEHVRRVLRNTSSLEEAASVLKINPSTLYRKRKRLGL
jgi:two-component system, NtrC family, response regulator AlgB